MNNYAPLIKVSIYLTGINFNPDDLTSLSGIMPYKTSIRKKAKKEREEAFENSWSFKVEKKCYSIDEAINKLLDHIWIKRHEFILFASDNNLEITILCNVHIDRDSPVYELNSSTLKQISQLNASLLMDIYDYTKNVGNSEIEL